MTKQTAWIDLEGYWLRDEPAEDNYTPKSDRQIDLKKNPIPPGLTYPRFVAGKWEEGSKPFPAPASPFPSVPNWALLKTGLQPFYLKYAATINLSSSVAFYLSAINTETNSPTASVDILRINLVKLVEALGIRLDAKDKTQINQLLAQAGFDIQI
jgi:hypothetical protein